MPEEDKNWAWKSKVTAKRMWTGSMAMPSWKRGEVPWRLPKTFHENGGAEQSTYANELLTGRHTSFVSTTKKLICGPPKACRVARMNGWTLPGLYGLRSPAFVDFEMAAAIMESAGLVLWSRPSEKNTRPGPYLQKQMRARYGLEFFWMLNWVAVECCWLASLHQQERALTTNTSGCVSLRYIMHFLVECLTRGWTVTEPSDPSCGMWVACGSGVRGFVVLFMCQTTSTVTNRLNRCGQSKSLRLLERHVPHLRAMDEILYGTIWRMVSPLLTTDDVVRCRTVSIRWNVGSRYGAMGEFYFLLRLNDPYDKHRHYDSDGNKK